MSEAQIGQIGMTPRFPQPQEAAQKGSMDGLTHLDLGLLASRTVSQLLLSYTTQYSCLGNPMDGGAWWAAVHGVPKSWTRLSDFTFIFHFHALEKEMAAPSSVLAWRIPGTGEPGGPPSMGLQRVGHDWGALAAAAHHPVGAIFLWQPQETNTLRAGVFHFLIFFFLKMNFYWSIVALQCYALFYYAAKWISYVTTCSVMCDSLQPHGL